MIINSTSISDRPQRVQRYLDEPIGSLKGDLLGRTKFARELAKLLVRTFDTAPFVVALYGSWGAGKTSLKNMVMEILHENRDEAPIVVGFNPWHWEGQTQIIDAFFQELEKHLWNRALGKNKREAAKALKRFARTLGALSHAAGGLDRLSKWIIVVTASLSVDSIVGSSTFTSITAVLSGLALFYQEVLAWFKDLFEKVSDRVELSHEKTLDERRGDVDKRMRGLSKRILVVIDDIDRLRADQIRQVFQLVKANANFPNVTYFLLFQRDVVERSLIDDAHIGREFLDKIVQYGIDLPSIERSRLERILTDGLANLLAHEPNEPAVDQARWLNVFSCFRNQFDTLRDVYRYLSTLSFHVNLMYEEGVYEVNKIDLIALESLRQFQPSSYRKLAGYKEIVTGFADSLHGGDQEARKTRVTEALADILHDVPEGRRGIVTELLAELFPIIAWASGRFFASSDDRAQLEADLRVCSRAIFDKYFLLALPMGELPQWRVELLVRNSSSRDKLTDEFRKLIQEELIGPALDRLGSAVDRVPVESIEAVILALFDVGDELPQRYPAGFEVGPNLYAERLIRRLLRRQPDHASRVGVLKAALTMSQGLSLPCQVVSGETRRKDHREPSEGYLLEEESTQTLIDLCLEKIRTAANQGRLQQVPELVGVLYSWREWAGQNEPSSWVQKQVSSAHGVLDFLKAIAQKAVRSIGDKAEVFWHIRRNYIEDFIPMSALSERTSEMQSIARTDVDRAVIRAFEETLMRK